jgi:hypothetical protein
MTFVKGNFTFFEKGALFHIFGTKKVMFWAFFDEKNVFSFYCESRFWHRDPGSEVFQHRNPGSEKERRDCKPYCKPNDERNYILLCPLLTIETQQIEKERRFTFGSGRKC